MFELNLMRQIWISWFQNNYCKLIYLYISSLMIPHQDETWSSCVDFLWNKDSSPSTNSVQPGLKKKVDAQKHQQCSQSQSVNQSFSQSNGRLSFKAWKNAALALELFTCHYSSKHTNTNDCSISYLEASNTNLTMIRNAICW